MDWINKMKETVEYDPAYEDKFIHYKPYAGGSRYKMETITDKPGFKVWVDGGVLTYDLEVCYAKYLDCSATCCLQSYCAPDMSMCIHYKRRSYTEVYIGIFVVTKIVAGIPTCILTVEFVINYKFGGKWDDQAEAYLGGMTICEGITYAGTCGKSYKAKINV